jgi:uncharacterized membrane protein
MELHQIVLVVTLYGAGIAAGVFFTFTAVVIPGLMDMDHRASLKGFQAIDGRLQPNASSINWQPGFGAAIFGTGFLTVATLILGWQHFSTTGRTLGVAATTAYNLGVWLPTFGSILPFNNRVRDLDLDAMSPAVLTTVHRDFERNWRGWNLVRSASSALAFALLMAVVVTQ